MTSLAESLYEQFLVTAGRRFWRLCPERVVRRTVLRHPNLSGKLLWDFSRYNAFLNSTGHIYPQIPIRTSSIDYHKLIAELPRFTPGARVLDVNH
jgi:hypothetical protein